MSFLEIILVVLSGLGVIHGVFLAVYLWTYSKGNSLANKLLSLLLIVLSFRIGKSVFLEFTTNLDVKFIFTGLGSILALGPLYYFFVSASSNKNFRFERRHLLHFLPLPFALAFGLWVEESHLSSLPLAFFILLFAIYYLHYLIYLVIGFFETLKKRKEGLEEDVYRFLRLLFFGLLVIWAVYVLNLFDDEVPYIVGPILYSIVAYVISFIVIKNGYIEKINHTKYKNTPVSDQQSDQLFEKVLQIMNAEKEYKNPDLTLKSLCSSLNVSPQVLSMVINQKSHQNFNTFINNFRIAEATQLLKEEKYKNQTIAAIAFDVGFNSISSFNTAFKKQIGKTPLSFRKEVIK
jgi:AraC-like DNA-binding protein